jgi:acyl carrier protein
MKERIFNQLVDIIVGVTGNDPEAIKLESNLEDDLGVVLDDDFARLIDNINQEFNIELSSQDVSEVVSTVNDLVNVIDEELELG